MNTSEENFEIELGRMAPADTSRMLRSSIAEELNTARSPRRRASVSRWSLWTAWSIAVCSACVAAALLVHDVTGLPGNVSAPADHPAGVSSAAPEDGLRMMPVDTSGVLLATLDEGIVYSDTGEPVRKVRLRFVDTVRLRDPDAQAAVEITYPREEIRYVPVATF